MESLYEHDIFKDGKINGYVNNIAAFYGCTAEFNETSVKITGESMAKVNMAQAAIEEFITSDFEDYRRTIILFNALNFKFFTLIRWRWLNSNSIVKNRLEKFVGNAPVTHFLNMVYCFKKLVNS